MLNEIKNLESNLTVDNLEKTFESYERLRHTAPRSMIGIGKPNRDASAIHAALDSLLNAMRNLVESKESEYVSRFAEDQNEG